MPLLLPVLLLLLTAFPPRLCALHVAPSGSDASPSCSDAAPCATIAHALAQAGPGDEVLLASGTYREFNLDLSSGATVASAPGAAAVLDIRGGAGPSFRCSPTGDDFFEGFDSATIPFGWNNVDLDGDNFFFQGTSGTICLSGSGCLVSQSWDTVQLVLTPDNWVVSPALRVAPVANPQLSFSHEPSNFSFFRETVAVLISTTGNDPRVDSFETVYFYAHNTPFGQSPVIDLSAYTDQVIWIAFRHYLSSDQDQLVLDSIRVTASLSDVFLGWCECTSPVSQFDFGAESSLLAIAADSSWSVQGGVVVSEPATAGTYSVCSPELVVVPTRSAAVSFDLSVLAVADGDSIEIQANGEIMATVPLDSDRSGPISVPLPDAVQFPAATNARVSVCIVHTATTSQIALGNVAVDAALETRFFEPWCFSDLLGVETPSASDTPSAAVLPPPDTLYGFVASAGTSTVRNITIRGGGVAPDVPARGLQLSGSADVTLEDVHVEGIISPDSGGLAYVEDSARLTLVDSTVVGTRASFDGGAIYARDDAEIFLVRSTLEGCTALDGNGGAIRAVSRASLTASQSQFVSCRAYGNGGAVALHSSSSALFSDCTARDNTATVVSGTTGNGGFLYHETSSNVILSNFVAEGNAASASGGVIYATSTAILTLLESTFVDSSADIGGGVACGGDSDVLIRDCTFEGSSVTNYGGHIAAEGSTVLAVSSSNLRSATAPNGAHVVVYTFVVTPTFDDCRFEDGHATRDGGSFDIGSFALVTVTNSVFLNNHADDDGGALLVQTGGRISVRSSTFDVGSAGDVGGAVAVIGSSGPRCELVDVTITDMTAFRGGAIYVEGEQLTLLRTRIVDAHSIENGGAMYLFLASDPVALIDVTLERCHAGGRGGGILSIGVSVTMSGDSRIDSVSAATDGGAFFMESFGHMTVDGLEARNTSAGRFGGLGAFFDEYGITLRGGYIQNSTAVSSGGALYSQSQDVVEVFRSEFHACSTGEDGGAFLLTGAGAATLTAVTVSESSALGSGGGLMAGSQSLVAIDSFTEFRDCHARQGGAIMATSLAEVVLTDGVLSGNRAVWGGALSASGSGEVTVASSNLTSNYADFGGGVAMSTAFSVITMRRSLLESNEAEDGGVAYADFFSQISLEGVTLTDATARRTGGGVYATAFAQIFIGGSTLAHLSAGLSGGAVFLGANAVASLLAVRIVDATSTTGGGCLALEGRSMALLGGVGCHRGVASEGPGGAVWTTGASVLQARGVDFGSCVATEGGAVAHYSTAAAVEPSSVDGDIYSSRATQTGGGGIYWDTVPIDVSAVAFRNNSAPYGTDVATPPERVALVDRDGLSGALVAQESGAGLSENVVVHLLDKLNNTVGGAVTATIAARLESGTESTILLGTVSALFADGEAVFSDLVLLSDPGSEVGLAFTSAGLEESSMLPVSIRDCEIGEVRSGLVCQRCGVGEYSVSPTDTGCRACPDRATCFGGAQMQADDGYFLLQPDGEDHIEAVACVHEASCPSAEGIGVCPEGHMGLLCGSCEDGYAFNFGSCAKCQSDSQNSGLLAAALLGMVFVVALVIVQALTGDYRTKSGVILSIKLLLSYLQVSSILRDFPVDWPAYLRAMFDVQATASGPSLNFAFLDCLLDNDVFVRLWLYLAMLPISLGLVGIVFGTSELVRLARGEPKATELRKQNKIRFTVSAVIITFALYPVILRELWQIFRCRTVDGTAYLAERMHIECWQGDHADAAIVAGVFLVAYGVGLPAAAVYVLYKRRNALDEDANLIQFGFLYYGFRKGYMGWESVIMLRKIVAVAIAVYIRGNQQHQIDATSLLIVASLTIQFTYQPFLRRVHRLLESWSLVAIYLSLTLASFTLTTKNVLYPVLIFIINLVTLIAFGVVISRQMAKVVVNKVDRIRTSIADRASSVLNSARGSRINPTGGGGNGGGSRRQSVEPMTSRTHSPVEPMGAREDNQH